MKFLTNIPLRLKTSEGEIILKAGDAFTPKSEEVIRPLLDRGVIIPCENNTPIPLKTFHNLLMESVRDIEKVYSPMIWDKGIMDTPEYLQAWDRLNDIQLACMQGKAETDALKEYREVIKAIIKKRIKEDSGLRK